MSTTSYIYEIPEAEGGGASINDATTSTTEVWSSDKVNTEIGNVETIFTGGTSTGDSAVDLDGNTVDFQNGKVKLSSTDNGFILNKGTTAQMNAISTPETDELFLNTDENGLYRYDGANWVALSAGYGVFEVTKEGDGGVPTFYATFESALDHGKTGDLHYTIKFHNNYEATSQIDITASNGFNFKSLTIDLNGYKLYNHQANGDDLLVFQFENLSTENQKIIFLNGTLERLNATSTAYALFAGNTWGGMQMLNCVVYNDNYEAGYLQVNEPTASQSNESNAFQDLGGTLFISENGNGVRLEEGRYSNFIGVAIGSGWGVFGRCEEMRNFKGISDSGIGVYISGNASHFMGVSNSDRGVLVANNNHTKNVSNFVAVSESDYAISMNSSKSNISNFKAYSESNYALYDSGDGIITNGFCVTNSALYAAFLRNGARVRHVDFLNVSGSYGATLGNNVTASNCTFTALAGVGCRIEDDTEVSQCTFRSEWNDAGGHAVLFANVTNPLYLSLCKFETVNASANCLYSASAITVNAANNVYGATATTPVNANITITATGTPDSYGNIQE